MPVAGSKAAALACRDRELGDCARRGLVEQDVFGDSRQRSREDCGMPGHTLASTRSLISCSPSLIDLPFQMCFCVTEVEINSCDLHCRKFDLAASCAPRITYVPLRHKHRNFVIAAAQDGSPRLTDQHSIGISPRVPVAMKLMEVMPARSYLLTCPCGLGLQMTMVTTPCRSLAISDPIAAL